MADYLSTNTPRIRVTQTGPRGTHKMVFRQDPLSTQALAVGQANTLVGLMRPFMLSACAFPSAEYAEEGSDVFLPIAWTPVLHADGVEAASNAHEYGAYLNFVGRTLGGSRVAFYLFNVHNQVKTANNRLTAAENASLTALLDAFNGSAGILAGIDQNSFVMKGYANSGINGQVAKKSRALV